MSIAHITNLDRIFIAIRVFVGLLLVYQFGVLLGILLCFFSSITYNKITAILFNCEAFSIFDLGMFNELESSRNNIGCMIIAERSKFEDFCEVWTNKVIKPLPKFRTKPVKILGSFYSKRIEVQEAQKQLVKVEEKISSKEELEEFVGKRINIPFELNKPHWKTYFIENYQEDKSVAVYFTHHYIQDGLTGTFILCFLNDELDHSMIPEMPKVTYWQQFKMIIISALQAPSEFIFKLTARKDRNVINNEKKLDGRRKVSLSRSEIKLLDIKKYTSEHKLTINGFMMGVISQSIKEYFKSKGCNADHVNIIIPINLRFETPQKIEDVSCQNIISFILQKLPLVDSLSKDIEVIRKTASQIRGSMGWYIGNFIYRFMIIILPITVWFESMNFIANKNTLHFSNIIGPKNEIKIKGKRILEIYPFLNGNTEIGFSIVLFSYNNKLSFNVVSDVNRMEETGEFTNKIQKNIDSYLK